MSLPIQIQFIKYKINYDFGIQYEARATRDGEDKPIKIFLSLWFDHGHDESMIEAIMKDSVKYHAETIWQHHE